MGNSELNTGWFAYIKLFIIYMCKSRLLHIAVEKKVMWQQEINEER